jgi:hypothetical protein
VVPGLRAAGADLSRCFVADRYGEDETTQLQLPSDCPRLAARIRQRDVKLVVIDPVFAFTDPSADLEGPTAPSRYFMRELGRVAAQTGALIILSRNLTKDTSRGALAAGRGSGELGNAARCVLHLQTLPGRPGTFGLAVAACNSGRPVPTLTYRLADRDGQSVVEVIDTNELTADDLAAGEDADLDRSLKDQAKALLRHVLLNGHMDSKIIKGLADAAGIAVRTLQVAKRELKIPDRREGNRERTVTYWYPPKGGWPP